MCIETGLPRLRDVAKKWPQHIGMFASRRWTKSAHVEHCSLAVIPRRKFRPAVQEFVVYMVLVICMRQLRPLEVGIDIASGLLGSGEVSPVGSQGSYLYLACH